MEESLVSFLQSEIRQQPQVLMTLLDRETENTQRIAADLRARGIRYVITAARGTSDNAARYGQYLFGAYNRLPVGLATPSLFSVYGEPPRLEDGLVIGISQSGQSPDIVAVLEEGQRQRITLELLTRLLEMVQVQVTVTAGPDEITDLQVRLLRDHVGQQCVRRDIERHAEKNVCAALIELTRQVSVGDVKLEQAVAGRERHFVELGNIPGADDDAP